MDEDNDADLFDSDGDDDALDNEYGTPQDLTGMREEANQPF